MSLLPSIPDFSLDDSDRNRTSPVAFTGNKFEVRMIGSSQSLAVINTVLSTAVADSFSYFADKLEKADDLVRAKQELIDETLTKHGKIIYNGNNYSKEWEEEAKKRNLPNLKNTIDAMDALLQEKNIDLFERMKVYNHAECFARYEVHINNYIQTISIEANTLIQMIRRQILPALLEYIGELAKSQASLVKIGVKNDALNATIATLSEKIDLIQKSVDTLETKLKQANEVKPIKEKAVLMRDSVLAEMGEIRKHCDYCETIVDRKYWPIPTYTEILHSI